MPQRLGSLGFGDSPLAQGIAPDTRTGFEGMPFAGQGTAGQLLLMAAAPALQRAMGQVGMMPLGLGHDQNIYDTIRAMQFQQMQVQAMQQAAQSDRTNFMRTIEGGFRTAGVPFGAEQRRMAGTFAGAMTSAAPIMAMMQPDLLDAMGGRRGSATVMAQRMTLADRYRIDPITGRMGLSAESTAASTRRLFDDLYADPNIAQMHGISAGQLGGLYGELQKRGMLRTLDTDARTARLNAINELSTSGELESVARRQGVKLPVSGKLSGADIDKLGLDTTVMDKIRGFDSDKIKRSLKDYVGAIAAMRDIFGDAGHPNAPMQELMKGLEVLTAGSAHQIDPGRLSGIVRQTYNLAKQTGVSLDTAMMLQGHAASRAAAMGLEPIFATQATQGGMAFGGAYRATGQAAVPAWGLFNADQMQQLDMNLRVQGAASPLANRLAAAMRIRDTVGGFQAGGDAYALTQALASGMDTFIDSNGKQRSVALSDREFVRAMTGARGARGEALGMSENDIRDFVNQRDTNREYTEKYGLMPIVRRRQGPEEIVPFIGGAMQHTVSNRLRAELQRRGIADAAGISQRAARKIGQTSTRQAFAMSKEDFRDTDIRNQNIAAILERELAGTEAGRMIRGMTDDERRAFLTGTAEQFVGSSNRALAGSRFRAIGNVVNAQSITDKNLLNSADQQQMQAANDAQLQEALSPLGGGSALRNAVDALQKTRTNDQDTIRRILSESIGGVSKNEIAKAMTVPAIRMHQQLAATDELMRKISTENDPAKKADLMKQLEGVRRSVYSSASELATIGKQHGLSVEGAGAPQAQRAAESSKNLLRTQADLVAVRAGGGDKISDSEINDLMARRGPAEESDAAAVLLFRRRERVRRLRENPEAQKADPQLQAIVDKIGKERPGISLDEARKEALNRLDRDSLTMTDQASQTELDALRKDLRIVSPEEARVVRRAQRRRGSGTISKEEIEKTRQEFGNQGWFGFGTWITADQATEVILARRRAERMGISREEIKGRAGGGSYGDEIAATDAILGEREKAQYTVTDEQADTYLKATTITDAQREEFRKRDPAKYGTMARPALDREMAKAGVLKERALARRERFNEFWNSEGGDMARDATGRAEADMQDIAQRLLVSRDTVSKMGTRGIAVYEEITGGQQRLRELARKHAGGDMARLMAGDFDPNVKDPMAVQNEVMGIQKRQRQIQEELSRPDDGTVRWGTDKEEAERIMKLASAGKGRQWDAAGLAGSLAVIRGLSAKDRDRLRNADLGTMDEAALDKFAKSFSGKWAGKDVRNLRGVMDAQDEAQLKIMSREKAPGASIAVDVLKAYGLDRPDGKVTVHQRALGAMIEGSPDARGMARRLLSTRDTIKDYFGRNADRTMARYGAMSAKEREQFVAGLGSSASTPEAREKLARVKDALEYQQQTGFLGRRITNDRDVFNLFNEQTRMKTTARGTKPTGDTAATGPTTITGTLTIKGDVGSLAADMGGSRGIVT